MKSMLVAYDLNRGIGASNDLLWQRDLPADLRRFKELTTDNTIIMGRKTYESIGRPLPRRKNIVISRGGGTIEGVVVVPSLEEAYAAADPNSEIFVIGGGQIYALALDTVDRIFATEVKETFPQASVFFPEIDMTAWKEISREAHFKDEKNLYDYDFVEYVRS